MNPEPHSRFNCDSCMIEWLEADADRLEEQARDLKGLPRLQRDLRNHAAEQRRRAKDLTQR